MGLDHRHVVATISVLTLFVTGCQFPEQCESYPGQDDVPVTAASGVGERPDCELTLKYQERVYTVRTGALVTDVGESLDGVEVRGCPGTHRSQRATNGGLAAVKVFTLGPYCASDALAVEVEEGEQLLVFEATGRADWVLP